MAKMISWECFPKTLESIYNGKRHVWNHMCGGVGGGNVKVGGTFLLYLAFISNLIYVYFAKN